jgi:hypothetical protein
MIFHHGKGFTVVEAFNQQMQQLFSQHKESIDNILYGRGATVNV